MPSTPLNVLVCAALANSRRETDVAELWLVDQKQMTENPYFMALQQWRSSPFTQIKILPGLAKGYLKLKERKSNFGMIEQGLQSFNPDIIAVGSDRRIEFQYAMHWQQSHNHPIQGWYLDDGLYSYSGRPYHPFKDGFNSVLKKLSYGLWWQEPRTVGASSWIDQAWLFQPLQVVPELNSKNKQSLSSKWFKHSNIQSLSECIVNEFKLKSDFLSGLDYVIIVPHPNNQLKILDYEKRIKYFVSQLSAQDKKVAVKYHPRQAGEDDLGFLQVPNVVLIPSKLAFEFVLPLLPTGTKVIGDVCTVMLTTKWLRGDLDSIAVLNKKDIFQQRFIPMYTNAGVTLINDFKELNKTL